MLAASGGSCALTEAPAQAGDIGRGTRLTCCTVLFVAHSLLSVFSRYIECDTTGEQSFGKSQLSFRIQLRDPDTQTSFQPHIWILAGRGSLEETENSQICSNPLWEECWPGAPIRVGPGAYRGSSGDRGAGLHHLQRRCAPPKVRHVFSLWLSQDPLLEGTSNQSTTRPSIDFPTALGCVTRGIG